MVRHNVDVLLNGSPEQFKVLLTEFRDFLARQPTRNGVYRNKTIWKYIQVIRYYLIMECETIQDINANSIVSHILDRQIRGQLLGEFKKFVKFAVDNNYINKQIFKDLKEVKLDNKKVKIYINPENEKKWSIFHDRWDEVYKKVPKGKNSFLFGLWLGFNFGLRTGEIVHLTVDNIYLNDRSDSYLLIQPTSVGRDIWEPKTEYSIRKLFITKTQKTIISNYIDNRARILEEYFPKQQHNFLIYTNQSGKQISENTFWNWCSSIKLTFNESGKTFTRKLRPHILRYSSAVHLYYSSLNIYAVSKFLGHNSVQTTEQYLALAQAQRFDVIKDVMLKSGL